MDFLPQKLPGQMTEHFKTPILLIAWRRPNHLKQVITALKKVKPKNIYAAVDGPRIGLEFEEERQLIKQTKEIIRNEIDWDCKVTTLFRDENLGCAKGVSSAITWFFEHVEEGIILEDDIVITENGLKFFEWGLNKFRHKESIWMISAWNPYNTFGISLIQNYFYCWGWATWKRTWQKYSLELPDPKLKYSYFSIIQQLWEKTYQETISIDTWDYPMQFWMFKYKAKAVMSPENYVDNVGFDSLGVHTVRNKPDYLFRKEKKDLEFKVPLTFYIPKLLSDFIDAKVVRYLKFGMTTKEIKKLKRRLFIYPLIKMGLWR
jgi:hypothetical protein